MPPSTALKVRDDSPPTTADGYGLVELTAFEGVPSALVQPDRSLGQEVVV